MSEEINGSDDVKKLFRHILGSEITIRDNIDATEAGVFNLFITKLEESYSKENRVFEEGGIDLSKITDPMWFVIENSFKFLYGEDAAQLIFWYIFDRFNPDGSIIPLEDEQGKKYIFKTPDDLWSYINHRFPQ